MQFYFVATMSPIPLALLGIGEIRQMGVSCLRNFAGLVLGYAALAFTLNLFPTLLQMAVATSWKAGGTGEMILSVTAGCILEIILVVKCGSCARRAGGIGTYGILPRVRTCVAYVWCNPTASIVDSILIMPPGTLSDVPTC